jgi:uncharacterized protein YicC (UPF0701 family)
VHAELSSLNNRYLDINLKVPAAADVLPASAARLPEESAIQRGKISLFLSVRKILRDQWGAWSWT